MQSPTQEYADVVPNQVAELEKFDWKARRVICLEVARLSKICNFDVRAMQIQPFGPDHRGHITLLGLTLLGDGDRSSTETIQLPAPVVRCDDEFITL
jgi:hypothetical protein